ncbi:MAG TPA: ABC transporter substrate-binding protein, partial [Solirubrobacterales bacterium]|nr:ABC transporter substrate-binding protein [Solirubrobacterales bacterium]
PQVVLAREKGAPIVALGSLISQPTAAMIWLRNSGVSDIADLKGKTIAIPGLPFQRDFLEVALAQGGLTLADVKVKNVGYDLVPALVSGRADAIFGGSRNLEGAVLETWGLDPVITRVQDLGIPLYDELVLIARPDRVAENPRMIRGFMSALSRGTAAAVGDRESALDSIEGSGETNIEVGRRAKEVQLEATLPLLSRSAYMNPTQASELVHWMHEQGMIQRKLPASAFLTNAYLPEP